MLLSEMDLETRYLAATAAVERGEIDSARRLFELVLLDAPRFAPAWDGLGTCYEMEDDLNKAGDCFRRAMRCDRNNWRSRYNWGAALHRAGDVRTACKWLREAGRIAPTERRILHRLGTCYSDLGEHEEALRWFRRALEQPEREIRDAELYMQIGEAERERGDLEAAEKAYERACLLSPDDPSLYYHWALLTARAGDLWGAQRLAFRARALDPRTLRYALLPVRLAADAGDWVAAEARITELRQTPGTDRLAQALRAELASKRGDLVSARRLALSALTMEGPASDQAVDLALEVVRKGHGRVVWCQGFRVVVEVDAGEQMYFRPYVVLAENETDARDFVAELQETLDRSSWRIAETEYFEHDAEALAGVYQVLLTRVLFPRDEGLARLR